LDTALLDMASIFSKHDIDISLSKNIALFYPHIEAYVRCGNLMPEKLFDLLAHEHCQRIIVFGGTAFGADGTEEAFHSFEMRVPKAYVMERLEVFKQQQFEVLTDALQSIKQMKSEK
jgi:hypothetical protein